jgi:hypothetical protein
LEAIMETKRNGRVEDYTGAFLTMAGLLILSGLVAAWAMAGFLTALAGAMALQVAFARLAERRAQREAEWEARVAAALARARG